MVKSIIKKSSAEFDLEKIRRFTQLELTSLAQEQSELPFCYQIGTDVLVGANRVIKINEHCWRVMQDGQQIFDFFNRKDAIFYCIALHKQQTQLAKYIQENDSLLNRLQFEAILYRIRYKKAQVKGDSWGEEFYSNCYIEIQHRIEQVKKEIKKNLNLAKYIKV